MMYVRRLSETQGAQMTLRYSENKKEHIRLYREKILAEIEPLALSLATPRDMDLRR